MSDITHAPDPRAGERSRLRRIGLFAITAIVVIAAIVWGIYWFIFSRYFISTDDAYVGGYVVSVTSREPGLVLAIHADNTQFVHRGDLLVEFDSATADVAMQQAEADLARTVRQVRGTFSKADGLRAQIAQARVQLSLAQGDYKRRVAAQDGGAVSKEDVAHARDAVAAATAALSVTGHGLTETLAPIQGVDVANNPDVLAAAARLRSAALVRDHMKLYAPIDGEVAQRTVQVGTQVAAGTPLMAIVPLDSVWVDANFKEVQLKRMRVGQTVEMTTDLYGSGVAYHGRVAGFSPGSGNAFALLPPQNASGNWIKIVQRLPVRVEFTPDELKAHPLRIGLSVSVSVDSRDQSGPLMSSRVLTPARDNATQSDEHPIDALIAGIISANALASGAARK
jgi:membrane fusion protein (multidrug efflux system)